MIAVLSTLLVINLGVAALVGIGVLFVIVPVNVVLSKILTRQRNETQVYTDERVAHVRRAASLRASSLIGLGRRKPCLARWVWTATFSSVPADAILATIKVFAWEQSYLDKIGRLRERELRCARTLREGAFWSAHLAHSRIRSLVRTRAWGAALGFGAPMLATVAGFLAYQRINGTLTDAATLFSSFGASCRGVLWPC
jgi:hypothetical protein